MSVGPFAPAATPDAGICLCTDPATFSIGQAMQTAAGEYLLREGILLPSPATSWAPISDTTDPCYVQKSTGKLCPPANIFLNSGGYSASACKDACTSHVACAAYTVYSHGWCQLSSDCSVEYTAPDASAATYDRLTVSSFLPTPPPAPLPSPPPPPSPPPVIPSPPPQLSPWVTHANVAFTSSSTGQGTLTKHSGSSRSYADGRSTSSSPTSSVAAVAPTKGTQGYLRLCLTLNEGDTDPACPGGLMVGLWPDGRVFTIGVCSGSYVGSYDGGETFMVEHSGADLIVTKDGTTMRTCTGTAGGTYYAQVYIYRKGASIGGVALTPLTPPPPFPPLPAPPAPPSHLWLCTAPPSPPPPSK